MVRRLIGGLKPWLAEDRVGAVSNAIAALAAVFSVFLARDGLRLGAEQQEAALALQELEWQPVLNLSLRQAPRDGQEALGLFVENLGKGPARIRRACLTMEDGQAYSLVRSTAAAQESGLLAFRGVMNPEDMLGADETSPWIALQPAPGSGWSDDKLLWASTLFDSLQSELTAVICYESIYKGCYVTRRAPGVSNTWPQSRLKDCSDPCCTAGP